jgi:hypothetical protein
MIFFLGMLLTATMFFGLCFYNLTCKVYDFYVGIGDAYDLNTVDWVLLVLGTFFAGGLTVLCMFWAIVLGAHLF